MNILEVPRMYIYLKSRVNPSKQTFAVQAWTFFEVKSSAFGGTIKKSHLKDLQVLQTINVGAVRSDGHCSLPQGTVQARQLWLHWMVEMGIFHYWLLMERWGEGSRNPFVCPFPFFPSSKSVLIKSIHSDWWLLCLWSAHPIAIFAEFVGVMLIKDLILTLTPLQTKSSY